MKRKQQNKSYFDETHSVKNLDLKAGDNVLMLKGQRQRHHKFDSIYEGLFEIVEITGPRERIDIRATKFNETANMVIERTNSGHSECHDKLHNFTQPKCMPGVNTARQTAK